MTEEIELELTSDNPFSSGRIVDFEDGTYSLESEPIIIIESSDDILYEIIQGDTWTNLAYKFYGNSKLWHILISNNEIDNLLNDPIPGVFIRIPDPNQVNFIL